MNSPAQSTGAIVTVALHAAVVAVLLSYEPARSALLAAAPIMVDLITPPRPQPAEMPAQDVAPPPPEPKRIPKRPPRPVPKAPVITPITPPDQAPSAVESAAPPPEPAPPPVAVAPAPVPAPAPVVPPVFNADYLQNPAPAYPPMSRRLGEQGRVILRVLVNARGSADEVELRASSGFARLDETARETVKRWKFTPARRGEEAVPAWVLIPVNFTLEG